MSNARKLKPSTLAVAVRTRPVWWWPVAALVLLLLAGVALVVATDLASSPETSAAPGTPQERVAAAAAAADSRGAASAQPTTTSLAGPAMPESPHRHEGATPVSMPASRRHPTNAGSFTGDRAETVRFVAYERDIDLTPEQEQVRLAALTPLPAPCCKNFSAATCCCRCNMAKATWGLAKHLIVHEGASAERVRSTVAAWHQAINPDGFTGDACFTGGCSRAFAKNGCGGMEEGKLVF
jgi:hypothetical protein